MQKLRNGGLTGATRGPGDDTGVPQAKTTGEAVHLSMRVMLRLLA